MAGSRQELMRIRHRLSNAKTELELAAQTGGPRWRNVVRQAARGHHEAAGFRAGFYRAIDWTDAVGGWRPFGRPASLPAWNPYTRHAAPTPRLDHFPSMTIVSLAHPLGVYQAFASRDLTPFPMAELIIMRLTQAADESLTITIRDRTRPLAGAPRPFIVHRAHSVHHRAAAASFGRAR